MLPFRVIRIEQHRALDQSAAKPSLPKFCPFKFSQVARSPFGRKPAKLNRQIPEVERPVTSRKQTPETCSNRQKIQKRLPAISASTSFLSAQHFAAFASRNASRPTPQTDASLRSGCVRLALSAFGKGFAPRNYISNRFWAKNRRYGKQTIKPCLTGARTAIRNPSNLHGIAPELDTPKLYKILERFDCAARRGYTPAPCEVE